MVVRLAIPSDRLRVVSMLKEAHAAGALPFPFSAPHAAALFDTQCALKDRICIVYVPSDRARGVLMAAINPHPFGPFLIATEVIWWIDPEHRGAAGRAMLDAYEAWATEQGASFVGMAALAAAPRAGVIYERRGYQAAETHYLKPLAPAVVA